MRIGASAVRDGDCFPAPDQFCAALSEATPASYGAFGGLAVGSSIPALHGLDGDAIADFEPAGLQWLAQGRVGGVEKFLIAGDVQAEGTKMLCKFLDIFQ